MSLKGKFKDNNAFAIYMRKQKNPTYEERSLVAFSIIEAAVGLKLDEKVIVLFIKEIAEECGLDPKDVLQILTHILSDSEYFATIMRKYKAIFIKAQSVEI